MKVETMTAEQAQAELKSASARLDQVKARIARIRPPRPAPPAPSGGTERDRDPLEGAGDEYRTAFDAQDVARLRALRDELDELSIEEDLLLRRAEALRQRERAAQAAEQRAAAPEIARDAARAFTPALGRLEAAVAELRAARDAAQQLLDRVAAARRLAGEDAPGLSPEQLGAWWRLGLGPGTTIEVEVEHMPGVLRSGLVADVARYVQLPPRAVELVTGYAGRGGRQMVLHEMTRAIAAGATAVDAEVLAKDAIARIGRYGASPEQRIERATDYVNRRSRDALLAGE